VGRRDLYYARGLELGRLEREGRPRLEYVRTLELLDRFLPPPPALVLDVGGGPGAYAAALAERGYEVRLVDPVPLHVEHARDLAAGRVEARLGDARELEEADASADAVLLLGPLYHLVERSERLRALAEARRVARPGGVVVAAAISRFASLLDGLVASGYRDPDFVEIVRRDLADGRHVNPRELDRPEWFTTAYFHRPDELAAEVEEAGLELETVLAVEGPCWIAERVDEGADPAADEILLEALRTVEADPALLGASLHLLAVGRRPGEG
jgi:SAM-dependent methyltransferase